MSTTHYPPPHHHLSSTPISASLALQDIQSYLSQSTTSAYLHPDSLFIEREGPTFSSTASIGGVVLQQLRRVEAGLRGEWMGVDPSLELYAAANGDGVAGDEGLQLQAQEIGEDYDGSRKRKRKAPSGDDVVVDEVAEEEEHGIGDGVANYQEQLYMQGERDLEGEIGDPTNVVGDVAGLPEVHIEGQRNGNNGAKGIKISAEERKAAKKARKKSEKFMRSEERRERKAEEARVVEGGNEGQQEDISMLDVAADTIVDDGGDATFSPEKETKEEKKRRKEEKRAKRKSRGLDSGQTG